MKPRKFLSKEEDNTYGIWIWVQWRKMHLILTFKKGDVCYSSKWYNNAFKFFNYFLRIICLWREISENYVNFRLYKSVHLKAQLVKLLKKLKRPVRWKIKKVKILIWFLKVFLEWPEMFMKRRSELVGLSVRGPQHCVFHTRIQLLRRIRYK